MLPAEGITACAGFRSAGPGGLLYRNQFILGRRYREDLPKWRRLEAGNSWYLTVHPALNTCRIVSGGVTLTLLGYIIDPDNGDAGDEEILRSIMKDMPACGGYAQAASPYGGRWVLIAAVPGATHIFNDAAGLRQVFHSVRTGETWCASQPGMIAGHLGCKMDPAAIDFIDSYEFRSNLEFRWPGYSTPYRQIRHLLPNHSLELETGKVSRYWPSAELGVLTPEDAVERAAPLMQGLMKGVSGRYPLALSITAGLDSRVMLASCRGLRDIHTMTVRQIGVRDDYADIAVAAMIAERFGLRHDILKSSLILDDGFVAAFRRNVPVAHYVYAPDAQAILSRYGHARAAVTGSASEIARSSFRAQIGKPAGEEITPRDLAGLQGMGRHPFALEGFRQWLEGTGDLYGIDQLDLFEWEQGHGNWLAMCQLEFDIAWKEIFTPFNCRRLLEVLLSVERGYRSEPRYELFEMLIRKMWPELLTIPVNPHKSGKSGIITTMKAGILKALSRLKRQASNCLTTKNTA